MPKTRVCLGCGDLSDDGGQFCYKCRKATRGTMAQRIFVLTEDPVIIQAVREEFAPKGCLVSGEKNLDKVVNMMKKDVPNIVILDTETASTIGVELAREIKASQFGIHLVILSNTAKAKKIFEPIGADYFFVKPMDKTEFMVAIAKLLLEWEHKQERVE